MAISSSLATAASTFTNTTVIPQPKNKIDMTTFLQMLTTELSNQDPLKPMDDASFFGQIAQMGTVQGMDNLTKQNQVSEASSLIGKTIVATGQSQDSLNPDANIVTGTVTGLSIQNGNYYLNVREANGGNAQVTMDSIQAIGS
jgi:flagellar basal-body rod modification protein FlgD